MLERFIGLALTLGLILMAAAWWNAGDVDEAAPEPSDEAPREPGEAEPRPPSPQKPKPEKPRGGLITSLLGSDDDDDDDDDDGDSKNDDKKRGKGRG